MGRMARAAKAFRRHRPARPGAGPVLGDEGRLQVGQVDEAALADGSHPPPAVAGAQEPGEHLAAQVQLWNLVALLVLAGATFAAFNLTSRVVEAQRREIGVGMALGVRGRQLAVRPLLFGLQVALLGAASGVAVGLLTERLPDGRDPVRGRGRCGPTPTGAWPRRRPCPIRTWTRSLPPASGRGWPGGSPGCGRSGWSRAELAAHTPTVTRHHHPAASRPTRRPCQVTAFGDSPRDLYRLQRRDLQGAGQAAGALLQADVDRHHPAHLDGVDDLLEQAHQQLFVVGACHSDRHRPGAHGPGHVGEGGHRPRSGRGRRARPHLDRCATPVWPGPAPPVVTVEGAMRRLDLTGEPLVFFVDARTGRGGVAYRRYDGHYGLLAPGPAAPAGRTSRPHGRAERDIAAPPAAS